MTVVGYFLGGFEVVRMHLEKLIIAVVIISILPGVVAWFRNRGKKQPPAEV
jgi:membrane protein DedA with SNARE-associated domain